MKKSDKIITVSDCHFNFKNPKKALKNLKDIKNKNGSWFLKLDSFRKFLENPSQDTCRTFEKSRELK